LIAFAFAFAFPLGSITLRSGWPIIVDEEGLLAQSSSAVRCTISIPLRLPKHAHPFNAFCRGSSWLIIRRLGAGEGGHCIRDMYISD